MQILTIVSSFASIIALLMGVLDSYSKIIIVLLFLSCVCLLILTRFFLAFKQYLKIAYPSGYVKISTINRYATDDGNKILYEVYKHIQCKKAILTDYYHGFDWTGSQDPKITSDLQKVSKDLIKNNNGDYDKIHLQFKRPLLFNEIGIVHLKMDIDDSDRLSSPYIEIKVSEPTSMIQFQVILKYKSHDHSKSALLSRKKINSKKAEKYSKIKSVSFDSCTKSYDFTYLSPEVGYFYKLSWER